VLPGRGRPSSTCSNEKKRGKAPSCRKEGKKAKHTPTQRKKKEKKGGKDRRSVQSISDSGKKKGKARGRGFLPTYRLHPLPGGRKKKKGRKRTGFIGALPEKEGRVYLAASMGVQRGTKKNPRWELGRDEGRWGLPSI